MSFEKAKADLTAKGLSDHIIVLNESSATVAEAAQALGVEPARIAKTLSVLQGEKSVLIVVEGTAKLDNHKYKSLFHIKAKMIPYDEVETYVGHAPAASVPSASTRAWRSIWTRACASSIPFTPPQATATPPSSSPCRSWKLPLGPRAGWMCVRSRKNKSFID